MRLVTRPVVGFQDILEKPVRSGQVGGGRAGQGFGPRPPPPSPPTQPRLKPQSGFRGSGGQLGAAVAVEDVPGPAVGRGTRERKPRDQRAGIKRQHRSYGSRPRRTPERADATPRGPQTRKGHVDKCTPRTGHSHTCQSRTRPTSAASAHRPPLPKPRPDQTAREQSAAEGRRGVLYRTQKPPGPPPEDEAKARLVREGPWSVAPAPGCGVWLLPALYLHLF